MLSKNNFRNHCYTVSLVPSTNSIPLGPKAAFNSFWACSDPFRLCFRFILHHDFMSTASVIVHLRFGICRISAIFLLKYNNKDTYTLFVFQTSMTKYKISNIKTKNSLYFTLSSIGSINANPQETHFIKTSASSSVTAFGLVVAEPVKVT